MSYLAHLKGPKKDGQRNNTYFPSRPDFIDGFNEAVEAVAGKKDAIIPAATADSIGGMKLYDSLGENVDGTITQAAITSALRTISDDRLQPKVSVTAPKGSTVTVTKGDIVLTASEDNGTWLFEVPEFGYWTISASKGENTSAKTISVNSVSLYNVTLSYFEATIVVTSPVGATLTCTGGGQTQTKTSTGKDTFTVSEAGAYTINGSCKNGVKQSIEVTVSAETEYQTTICIFRYGYRIKKSEGNPSTRVQYLYDAVGLTPAKMVFNGAFSYGSWGDKWFVTDNKPLMLKSDGTVDYYLNPNDYTFREDRVTPSDVANTSYNGNAMAQIPLVWVYRYQDTDYEYEIISNVQYDKNYKAYAHTRADGSIADYFYYSMFGGSGSATKIRSLSSQTLARDLNAQNEINGCKANGSKWYTHTWSQRELIRTLLILMGKSTDTQAVFGNGNCCSGNSSNLLQTGTLKDKGQFFGYNSNNQQVKVFHIEKFWGDQWDRTAGIINNGGKIYAKMTPEGQGYRVTDVQGYTDTGVSTPAANGSFISGMKCSEFGMIPTAVSGSGTTYYCDAMWSNNNQLDYLLAGAGAAGASAHGGAFTFIVDVAPSFSDWRNGCGLSCEQPV